MTNNLDFYGYLKEYCARNSIYFIPGPEDYQNAVMDASVYDAYDLILCSDLTLTPSFGEDFGSVTYNGTIALGRKREDDTVSTLDETFAQKYEARLCDLMESIINMLNELQCNEDAEVISCTAQYAINQYDLNADFVVAAVSIKFY